MSNTRRTFLLGLSAVAVGLPCVAVELPMGLGLPRPLGAEPSFNPQEVTNTSNIQIGYCSLTWGPDVTQAIKDIGELGYKGVQTGDVIRKAFPDPLRAKAFLATYGTSLVAMSSTVISLDPSVRQKSLDQNLDNARYVLAAGGKYLQLTGTKGAHFSSDDCKREGELLTEVGEQVTKLGLQVALHNHMGSIAQTPEGLDAVLSESDPRYVKLLLDVGHYYLGGGDPSIAIRKYKERLLFLHLKDTSAKPGTSDRDWVELGRGNVDFKVIFAALKGIDFHGWGLVELDAVPSGSNRTPRESALISRKYLIDELRVAV
jgi:inosose dehydratase